MKLAAIDIGSNSIKLLVVDAAASNSFAVLTRAKEAVRLGHLTLRERHLSPEAITRAADCIMRFHTIAVACGAEEVLAVATASVREAYNSAEFIEEIRERVGVRVEILSGIEEARLIGIAAAQGCGTTSSAPLINIDIGGGSTEFSLVEHGTPVALFSVRLGAVRLTERFIMSDPAKPEEVRALRSEVQAALERPARELGQMTWHQVTGTSGTIIAIGETLRLQELAEAERKAQGAQPFGAQIELKALERFNARVSEMDASERKAIPGISEQRSEILLAGGQILEGTMRALDIKVLRTCDWSLREGSVIDRLRELDEESRPPMPDTLDQRLRGVYAVGRRFGYEEAHAHQVARLAEKIFDSVAHAYSLKRHDRTLLSAAALLHDIGYHIAHESHHKHALYLIKHSELTGFTEQERDVIANIVRYHRGALPKERHTDYAALNRADRETVLRLGAILRLADALDRSHDGRIKDLRFELKGEAAHLQLLSEADCSKEISAAEQKRDMFEQTFNCKLSLQQLAS